MVQFTWHPAKARQNLRKHRVSFDEATTVFEDPLARIHSDPDHSSEEWREIIVGHSRSGKLLLVSFSERSSIVRIITARMPDAEERQEYEESS